MVTNVHKNSIQLTDTQLFLNQVIFSEYYKSLKTLEDGIPYMYLDIDGNITLGYGHLVAELGKDSDALKLSRALYNQWLPLCKKGDSLDLDFFYLTCISDVLFDMSARKLYSKVLSSSGVRELFESIIFEWKIATAKRLSKNGKEHIEFLAEKELGPRNVCSKIRSDALKAAIRYLTASAIVLLAQKENARLCMKPFRGYLPTHFFTCKGETGDNNLVLTSKTMQEIALSNVNQKMKRLRSLFPDFDSYPMPAMLAILDMAFNLGTKGFSEKFPSCISLIRKQEWDGIAHTKEACHRKAVGANRNDYVKEKFNEAARIQKDWNSFKPNLSSIKASSWPRKGNSNSRKLLTVAGHCFHKHGTRNHPIFPAVKGNEDQKNQDGEALAIEILNNPKTVKFKSLIRPSYVDFYQPNGLGVRFDKNGNFFTFVDTSTELKRMQS